MGTILCISIFRYDNSLINIDSVAAVEKLKIFYVPGESEIGSVKLKGLMTKRKKRERVERRKRHLTD